MGSKRERSMLNFNSPYITTILAGPIMSHNLEFRNTQLILNICLAYEPSKAGKGVSELVTKIWTCGQICILALITSEVIRSLPIARKRSKT